MSDHAEPVLAVHDLTVDFHGGGPAVRAVSGLSLEIRAGETLALVGESGSGKTTTALAALGLLPPRARTAGRVLWKGRDILGLDHAELRPVRGLEIGLIPQDPMTALHPLIRVDTQVAEALAAHQPGIRGRDARSRAAALLDRMGIPPDRLAGGGYPHQWSGGMRQRALIAMAVANRPALIIADEPTTALDAATEADVLALLREIRRESGAAMLLITRDLAVVLELADRLRAPAALPEPGSGRDDGDGPPHRRRAIRPTAVASTGQREADRRALASRRLGGCGQPDLESPS